MKKIIIIVIVSFMGLLSASNNAKAQGSPVGIGIRVIPFGGAGFTAKFFLDRNLAIETQLDATGGYYNPAVTFEGLAEYHFYLPDPSLRIFLGGGVHFGSWNRYGNENVEHTQAIFGIDGVLGMEYVFKTAPIGISVDINPAFNFVTDVTAFPNNFFGISGRYYIGHHVHHPVRSD